MGLLLKVFSESHEPKREPFKAWRSRWNMNPFPWMSLGYYEVQDWDPYLIGSDLTKLTADLGLVPHVDPAHGPLETTAWFSKKLHAEVRDYTFSTKQAEDWHQDGDTTPGSKMDCCLVTWASSKPTEFQYKGQVYQPEPREVVIVRNLCVKHRRPSNCARYRWMFRQRVAVPKHIQGLP